MTLPNVLRLVDGELKLADGKDAKEYLREFAKKRGISPSEPLSLQTHSQAQRILNERLFNTAA